MITKSSLKKLTKNICKVQTYYFIEDTMKKPYGYVDRLGGFVENFEDALLMKDRQKIEEVRQQYISDCFWFKTGKGFNYLERKIKVHKIEKPGLLFNE